MKKINLKNLNYKTIIAKLSENAYKKHEFSKEWKTAIITIIFFKIATHAVSIYAGYNYIYLTIAGLLNSHLLTTITSVIFLFLVEILTMVFLAKFFKFLLRGLYKTALFPFIASVILFSLSFYISTNGLAMKQSSNADNSNIITEQYETTKQQINDNYKAKTDDLKLFINTIKSSPEGWSNGKRTILLKSQIHKIDSLYNNISILQTEQKQELSNIETDHNNNLQTNKTEVTSEATKFFRIVTIVMVLQFLFNGSLMFFYSKIYQDNNKETYMKEAVNQVVESIDKNILTYALNRVFNTTTEIMTNLEIHNQGVTTELNPNDNNEIDSQRVAQKSTLETSQTDKKKVVIGGFGPGKKHTFKDTFKNDKKTPEAPVVISASEKVGTLNNRQLLYLKKHKKIIANIKQYTDENKGFVSNKEVQEIQNYSKYVSHKSETVIRKIYLIMQGIGFENIDENGNIIK